jgi:hypothetical protein
MPARRAEQPARVILEQQGAGSKVDRCLGPGRGVDARQPFQVQDDRIDARQHV